jgi:hypothetical protein
MLLGLRIARFHRVQRVVNRIKRDRFYRGRGTTCNSENTKMQKTQSLPVAFLEGIIEFRAKMLSHKMVLLVDGD